MYTVEPEDFALMDFVRKNLDSFLSYFNETGDFSVTFVSDDEIRNLNREYRNIDSPTDILTFRLADGEDDFPSPEGEEMELGDIFISLESMRRNASEFGVDENDELRRLLLHGLMHLRGWDHRTNDFTSEPMLIEQERILKEIG